MSEIDKIFSETLVLKPEDKLTLIDKILTSIYPKNDGVEKIWEKESDARIAAFDKEHLTSKDEKDVFSKYKS